jgi:hypothetical protein
VRRRVVASERARLLAAIEPDGDRSAVAAALVDASGGRRAWSEVAWLADVEEVPPTIAMVGDWAVSASTWAQLRTVAVDTVAQRTPANRDEVADALVGAVPGLPADVALRAIDRLIDGNLLARIGTELVLPEHADATVAERRRRKSALVAALEESGLDPPPLAALRREHGLTAPEVDELARARELVVSGDVGFSRAQFEGAVARLVDAFGDGWFTVSEARQVLGVPRRATLALLAATDRGRVTEMRDDAARRVATTSGGGGALRSPRATRS